METNNIDNIFKKLVDESADFYNPEAQMAKEHIWEQVQLPKPKPIRVFLFRAMVAASILLFICTLALTSSYIGARNKIKNLARANSSLSLKGTENRHYLYNTQAAKPYTQNTDTVYIVKKAGIPQPVITPIQVIDTVFVNQIVYVEKEQSLELLLATENTLQKDSLHQRKKDNYKTEILITNNEPEKKVKRKLFQIQLGGNKDYSSEGSLALTTKF